REPVPPWSARHPKPRGTARARRPPSPREDGSATPTCPRSGGRRSSAAGGSYGALLSSRRLDSHAGRLDQPRALVPPAVASSRMIDLTLSPLGLRGCRPYLEELRDSGRAPSRPRQ